MQDPNRRNARRLLQELQRGTLDRSELSSEFDALFAAWPELTFERLVERDAAYVGSLGDIQSLKSAGTVATPEGPPAHVFRVDFSRELKLTWIVSPDAGGGINRLVLQRNSRNRIVSLEVRGLPIDT